jgi:hypothetical protein
MLIIAILCDKTPQNTSKHLKNTSKTPKIPSKPLRNTQKHSKSLKKPQNYLKNLEQLP